MNGLASTKMRPTFLSKNLANPQTEIIIQSYGIISEKWKTTYTNGKEAQEMKCLPCSLNNRAVKETDRDKHRIRDQMNNERGILAERNPGSFC